MIDLSGTISDKINSFPIEGVNVLLEIKPFGGSSFSNSFDEITTTETNTNGEYLFSFQNSNAVEYRLTFTKQGCFSEQIVINPDQLSISDNNVIDATLYSSSYLVLNITNNTPFNNDDQITLNTTLIGANVGSCFNNIVTMVGSSVDTTIECEVYGNQMIEIDYFVTKDNFTNAFSDNVFCSSGDTLFKYINY
ncbi:MAG: hypothetical protein P8M12_02005 [Flavobacteriales bacterium]|jgi:hypothetical protein|nr:hypothetical protein [Flavobacteriales bacterium]